MRQEVLTGSPSSEYFALQSEKAMTDLQKAIGDISSIRRQMARTTEFHGYGPATLASTGVLALVAAEVQARCLPEPANRISLYLAIWTVTAFISAVLTGVQMYTRARRIHSALSDEMIHMAVEQFMPSLGTGTLLTIVLAHVAPASAWIIPGLWQVIFSLGIFASCRFLPRPIIAAALWYLLTGLACLSLGDTRALSPWAMAIPFGIGQLLVAGILRLASREVRYES
jgi:hypothetical protein